MIRKLLLPAVASLALAAMLGGCTQKNTADEPAASGIPAGLERFLLFPNPVAQSTGGFETDTSAYAQAYYHAIDPADSKDTIDKWKTANNFGGATGTEHLAVFRDVKDLGYGRRMTGRRNADGSVAFFVENYNVTNLSGGGYDNFNVDAAVARDTRWHVGTNAIEWSTSSCIAGEDPADCVGSSNNVKFAKYYNFSSADGTRQLAVDLDGKGKKAMPGPCITCHGGRGDPLTPADVGTGKPRFPLVENSLSRKRGDVQAKLHGMNVDSFGYSTQPGFTKADQQAFLKDFNQWILCTYPAPGGGTVTGGWGSCTRPTAGANEWQGTAGPMIEAWYGGTGMSQATFLDNYVPAGWSANPSLYTNVVAPYCRTCHILRGTANQNDIDFMALGTSTTGFQSFADRIKTHVFERGNMPLALIVYDDFWKSSAPNTLAAYIDTVLGAGTATSASGAALTPGRPIADAGPNRMVRTNANAILTAENSLFASTFSWTMVSGSATISNANGMIAIFNAGVAGTYVVRLTVGNGASTNSKDVTITVDDNFPDPLNIRFAHVKNVLQNIVHTTTTPPASQKCTACHTTTAVSPMPPIFYSNFDRNGSGAVDATDDAWFLKALAGRVNLTEIEASALLRKPSGSHHNGLKVIDVADTSSGGGLRNYSILYNWILAGMLPGGVAANSIVNNGNLGSPTPVPLTFSGSPLFSTGIAVDGSSSVGATNFLWSASGPTGPTGEFASFANPATAITTLNLPNVGTYVVQLHVDDGVSSDVVQRTLTVSEAPIVANFNPQTGSVLVTFTPSTGNITLTSTSTYGAGAPTNCRWQITPPAGVTGSTLDGSTTLDITKSCGSTARLNVPIAAAGGVYQVLLTASTLGSNSVTHSLTISNSAPTASLANTTTPQAVTFGASATNTTIPTNTLVDGTGTSGTATFANVTSSVSLNGSASTTPTGTLTYAWCLSSQPDVTRFPASIAVCPSMTSSGALATTTMTVRATGSYTVQLTVDNGLSSSTVSRVVVVNPFRSFKFTDVANTLASPSPGCTGCHSGFVPYHNPASNLPGFNPPDWANVTDTDGTTLYQRLRQRVNLATSANSLLLLNPSNDPSTTINTNGHGGGCLAGFNIWGVAAGVGPYFCPDTSRANYDNFRAWILDGAPPGN